MAITWDWKDKIGEAKNNANGCTLNIYTGNCLAVAVYEDGDSYTMGWFLCDQEHAKKCLGLTKGCNDIFGEDFKIVLYRNVENKFLTKTQAKIAELFAKSMHSVEWVNKE